MLALPQLDEIRRLLDELPRLVNEFDGHDYDFHLQALKWLEVVEETMARYGLIQASDVALQRLEILKASRRQSGVEGRTRARRMDRERVAARAVGATAEAIREALSVPLHLVAEGRQVARQIAAIADSRGLPQLPDDSWPSAESQWESITSDEGLAAAAAHLVGLVGRHNAIMLTIAAQAEV